MTFIANNFTNIYTTQNSMHVVGFATAQEGVAVFLDQPGGGDRLCLLHFNALIFAINNMYSGPFSYVPNSATSYQSGTTKIIFVQGTDGTNHVIAGVSSTFFML